MDSQEAGTPPVDSCSSANGNSAPAANGNVESPVTNGIGKLALETSNWNSHSAPAIHGIVDSTPVTNGIGHLELVTDGICNLALLTPAARQVQQQVLSDQTSRWIPKALSFSPYVHPSSAGRLVKQNGRVVRGFHLEKPQQEDVTRCPVVVFKMTTDLKETYQICNLTKRILTNPSHGVSNNGRDNVENDLILHTEDVLDNAESKVSYVVKEMLGKGSYGQVCQCWTNNPKHQKNQVAVKVIKSQVYLDSAEREMNICKALNDRALFDRSNIVRFVEGFKFAGHLCLVFELLSIDLRVLLNLSRNAGLSIKAVRRLTIQILEAVAALQGAGVVHCDIKPENIVLDSGPPGEPPAPVEAFIETILKHLEALRNAGGTHPGFTQKDSILLQWFLENHARIKLIDFGIASRSEKTYIAGGRNTYIQSRHYRAPEIVLKLPFYTPAIDMWSVGCVAAELFLGVPLFMGANEYDLFRFMVDILGSQPPDDIISGSEDEIRASFFKKARPVPSSGGRPSNISNSTYEFLSEADIEARVRAYGLGKPKVGKRNFGSKGLGEIIMETKSIDTRMTQEQMTDELDIRKAFFHFLLGLLQFDYRKRWTPKQALQHPFLTGEQFLACPVTPSRE